MLKKILYSFIISVSILLCATATVNAAQKTTLPVRLHQAQVYTGMYEGSVTLNVFEINKVYAISSSRNRVEFNIGFGISSGAHKYIQFNCYDIEGYLIEKHMYKDVQSNVLDISNKTATIEVTVSYPYYDFLRPERNSDSYIYRKFVTVHADDGRSMTITDLLLPTYEAAGWYSVVTMYALDGRVITIPESKVDAYKKVGWYTEKPVELYALDGRTITVPKSKVDAYINVGWYTYDGLEYYLRNQRIYQQFITQVNQYIASGSYNDAMKFVDDNISQFFCTQYEQDVYAVRTQIMDLWRITSGSPMGFVYYSIKSDSNNTPVAKIAFRNISYKKIIAYKVKFTCYNVFGDLVETNFAYYYDDKANVNPGDLTWLECNLYGADSVYSLGGIKVTEVVFEDGTKWVGN